MRILITGGAGFIGSHLAEKLINNGETVTVIDDLSTGSIKNIAHLEGNKNFNLVVDTVLNGTTLEQLIRNCDIVYHMAAAVGVKLIVTEPVKTIVTNIRGTEIVLDLASKWRKKVILASTSEIYGKNDSDSFSETDDMVLGTTTKSRWSYAASKAIDEFLALAYYREKNQPVIILRLFNIVGPRQTGRYGMVIPTFIQQALKGEPITVFGNGNQTRSFTYITDLIDVITKLPDFKEAYGEVFNIGGEQEISMMDLASLVKEKTGSKSEIILVPYDQAYEKGFEDMMKRVPNVSKIKRIVDFSQSVNMEQIIEKIIAYFKQEDHIE